MHIISVYETPLYTFLHSPRKKSKSMITLFTTVEYGIYFGLRAGCKKGTIDLNISQYTASLRLRVSYKSKWLSYHIACCPNSARRLLTHQMHPFISIASYINSLKTRWENRQHTGKTKTPQQSAMLDHHFTLIKSNNQI